MMDIKQYKNIYNDVYRIKEQRVCNRYIVYEIQQNMKIINSQRKSKPKVVIRASNSITIS